MRPKHRVLLFATALSLLAAFTWFLLRPREPIYQGKPLSAWLEQYCNNSGDIPLDTDISASRPVNPQLRDSAEAAIRQIGTNGLPVFLDLMSRPPDSTFKQFLRIITSKFFPSRQLLSDRDYHLRGVMGIRALGTNAAPAVPRLIQLLNDPNDNHRIAAASALNFVGPAADAVPDLIARLRDTNWVVGYNSLSALRAIHSRPDLTVPAFMGVLAPTNSARNRNTCYLALSGLAMFGPEARPAVPLVLPYLTDRDAGVRVQATNALKKIDPAAAATAGIQ